MRHRSGTKERAFAGVALFAFALAAAMAPCCGEEVPARPRLLRDQEAAPCPMERYAQRLTLSFADEEAAQRARIEVLPVYAGKQWAVSCRWDDNNAADLRMRDVMAAHGYRGTWYLNAPSSWFGPEMAPKLLRGGNSIGGHSMSHPFLALVNRNRQFWEVLAVRMRWEAEADRPVCSYSFSFCNFRNPIEGDAVHRDIATALRRAGYYHIANGWFNSALKTDLELSPILPSDGAPIDEAATRFLSSERHRKEHPHMSFSMHVWYSTPEAWANFEEQLDTYGGRPNWWYCNQNEYAAYRWQYRHAALGEPLRSDRDVTVRIDRPVLRELNDAIPLTLAVRGVPPEAVAGATCNTAGLEVLRAGDGSLLINLDHDRDQRLPASIGLIENPDNHDELRAEDVAPDFPDIGGLLHFRDGTLELVLDNRGPDPMEDVTVVYRLPPACKEGVVQGHVTKFTGRWSHAITPTLERPDYKYRSGTCFYAAQVDFTLAGRPGRLHLGCQVPGAERDASYPQGGFLVLGPVAEDRFSMDDVAAAARAGDPLEQPPFFAQELGLRWRSEGPNAVDLLDVEVIETSGRWDNRDQKKQYYLLLSTVHSDVEQDAAFLYDPSLVAGILLNGRLLAGDRAKLWKGENELLIVAMLDGKRFGPSNAGCFLRMTRPETRDRLANIRFNARRS